MNLADVEAEFINCIRSGGAAREEVFTFIEANVARHFNQGVQGLKYYEKFLTIVRRANVPDAVAEYQNRFTSSCDHRLLEQKVMAASQGAGKLAGEVERKEAELVGFAILATTE